MQPEVVGRGSELAAVERALTRAGAGPSGLVLQGEPGIGKTTLWIAAQTLATDRGLCVLSSRPTRSESGLPLGAFGDLFSDISPDITALLPEPQRHALEVALLRADPAVTPSDQRALSVATANLLRELADRQGPLLIAIDDVQWLDDSSAAILSFALRRIEGRRVGVVVSLRGTAPVPAPLGLDVAMPWGALESLTLGPLSLAELHRLLLAHLGQSVSRLGLIRIEKACGGNPFYALEIARALIRTGATVTAGEPLPIPDQLAPLMRQRIETMPARTNQALLVAAVAFEPSLEVLGGVVGTDVMSVLEPAVRDGLLAMEGSTARFSHPLLAAAVLARAEPSAIRHAHARLARRAGSDEARARHLGLAAPGPDAMAAEALEAAAEAARRRGAPIAAAEMFESARDLTPSGRPDDAARRTYRAALCYSEIGEMQRAGSMLEQLLRVLPPGTGRARPLQLLGQVRGWSVSFREALALALDALDAAGADTALRAEIELDIVFCCVSMGDFSQADVHARAAVAEGEKAGIDGLHAQALAIISIIDFFLGRGVSAQRMARALALEDPQRPGPTQMHPRVVNGLLLLFIGRLDQSIATHVELRSEFLDRGRETAAPMLSFYLVWASIWRGDLRGAERFAEDSRKVAFLHDDAMTKALALAASALADSYSGVADRARADAAEAVALFQSIDWGLATIWPLWALGFLELSVGNEGRVDELLRPLADMVTATGAGDPILGMFLPDEIDALIALGELNRAAALIEWLEQRGREQDRPWALAAAARCRGALAAARGDLGSAIAALDQAAVEHGRVEMPFEWARTLLVRGRVHRRRKEKRLADRALREAQAIFAELGAPLWAEKARTELDRIGLRPRAPHHLTETERRVATLAAGGMTNREVAQAAFLSPKTVDNVLGRVYRKLAISSRAELGAVMAGAARDSEVISATRRGGRQ
jgi:DNA-binding CsgD family transcriptional regulator